VLPCRVLVRSPLSLKPATLRRYTVPLVRTSNLTQTPSLYFQSLTHSSQFAKRDILSIFLGLRTLCEKHPGVGWAGVCKSSASPLTLVAPMSYVNLSPNSFRILLFRRPPGGWGPHIILKTHGLPFSHRSKQHRNPDRCLRVSSLTAPGIPPSPRHFVTP